MATLQERLQEKQGITPQNIKVGGVPLNIFQPNLVNNPIVAGVQQFGTGVAKGTAETVRGLGQLGGMVQTGVTKLTGIEGPRTTAYDNGGAFDQATTPQGAMQKIGYGAEKVAELVTPIGKEKGAQSILGATAKGTAETVKAAESVATGIPKEILTRAATPEYAPKIEKAIIEITDNPKQPYFNLAKNIASNIASKGEQVQKQYVDALTQFQVANPTTRFDVSPKVPEVAKALKSFETSGLKVATTKASTVGGKAAETIKILRSEQSPFSQKEVDLIEGLLSTMRNSTNVDVNDLISLRKKFAAAYDAVPLGVNGEPKTYHAAIMAMKEATEKAINDILPNQLKQANADYRRYEQLKDAFGNRIIDANGNLKDSAETFISNLGNLNKGELRAKVKDFQDMTGIDLVDEIQVLKDAQKLSPLFAETGSRTQDILRALIVGGIGGGALGPVGTSAGLAISSPRLVGKIATTIGKAKGLIGRTLGGMK